MVLDAGPVGEGNHGHMDALSIEMAAYGRPLIVDPGRYTYEENIEVDWRKAFRETRAHSTVTVDNADQGIYQRKHPRARFKIVQPQPIATVIKHELRTEPAFVAGEVYSPNYSAIHQRYIWFTRQRYWLVIDRMVNQQDTIHDYRLRYQLTPQAQLSTKLEMVNRAVRVSSPNLQMLITGSHKLHGELESAWVSQHYGEKSSAPRVCIRQQANAVTFVSLLCPNPGVRDPSDNICNIQNVEHLDAGIRLRVTADGSSDEWLWENDNNTLFYRGQGRTASWSLAR